MAAAAAGAMMASQRFLSEPGVATTSLQEPLHPISEIHATPRSHQEERSMPSIETSTAYATAIVTERTGMNNNPHAEFLIDSWGGCINDTNVKAREDQPPRPYPPKFVFSTWTELERVCGIGMLNELRFEMGRHVYHGKCAVIPVTSSWDETYGLFTTYQLQFSDEPDEDKPRLKRGDDVRIEFDSDLGPWSTTWRGRIMAPNKATSSNQINIRAWRPSDVDEDGDFTDDREYSSLTLTEASKMTGHELRDWSKKHCRTEIKVVNVKQESECIRLMGALDAMKMSSLSLHDFPLKDRALAVFRKALLCSTNRALATNKLFVGIPDHGLQRALGYITDILRPYQKDTLNRWEDQVHAKTAIVCGPSGSGKSFLGLAGALPFLLCIEVPIQQIKENCKEYIDCFERTSPLWDLCEETNKESVLELGRITVAAMLNDTVDDVYDKAKDMASKFWNTMSMTARLVLRVHGFQTELKVIMKILQPGHGGASMLQETLSLSKSVSKKESAEIILREFYDSHRVDGKFGDRRVRKIRGSAAYCIFALANFPGFEQSTDLMASFSKNERKEWAEKLTPLSDAHQFLKGNPKLPLSKDLIRLIEKVSLEAYHALISKAAIVCTTAAVATTYGFNIVRRAHAVVVDEFGRLNDVQAMGFYSRYWDARVRIFIGDPNQIPPQAFGPRDKNPFHDQCTTSSLERLCRAGADIQYLKQTSRFMNVELLDLCGLVNAMADLEAVPGSFEDVLSRDQANINKHVWDINSVLLGVNVEGCRVRRSRSPFCIETARAVMKDLLLRLKHTSGSEIVLLSPYNGQNLLLQRLVEAAMERAFTRREYWLIEELSKVQISTVDSFMGKERMVALVDTAGASNGHLFELFRTLVALTRARVSVIIFAPFADFAGRLHRRYNHPLAKLCQQLAVSKHIRTVKREEQKTFEESKDVTDNFY